MSLTPTRRFLLLVVTFCSYGMLSVSATEPVKLASTPSLSPDGSTLAISWRGDIWTVASEGGTVRRITSHPGRDYAPEFSPDGRSIAFSSDRTGSMQIHVAPLAGGPPVQSTFHTEGYLLESWYPAGDAFLATVRRDHFWRHAERSVRVANTPNAPERILFDAHAEQPALSPDGKRILFIREGTPWWRKGYRGAQSGQLWLYDTASNEYTKLVQEDRGCRSPMWHPNGTTVYYVSNRSGSFNLWSHCLDSGKQIQLTHFKDDSVVSPCISRDGSTIVFRHLFDLYRLTVRKRIRQHLLSIDYRGDQVHDRTRRQLLRKATDVAFTRDGLEIAFIAGGDVWIMDTILKEPRQVTNTPGDESEVLFSGDDKMLYFTSSQDGQPDIWMAKPSNTTLPWWRNTDFETKKITDDPEVEYGLGRNPRKPLLTFIKGRGDLWICGPDGSKPRRIVESWNSPHYDWSPDGNWITFAIDDANFNRDVYVYELDSEDAPYNISRHPDDDHSPRWSPDGKTIAFLGRRRGTETDIHYVQLLKSSSEQSTRDRKLEAAVKRIEAARKRPTPPPGSKESGKPGSKPTNKVKKLTIDFNGIHDRIRSISIPDTTESNLMWSPDSKLLAFKAKIGGKEGTYTVSPPTSTTPKLFSTVTGTNARWIRTGAQILWLANSVPTSTSAGGKTVGYSFSCYHTVDVGERYRAAFDLCWRSMRDYFYDGNLNNRDWTAVRGKYSDMAASVTTSEDLARVVSLMLGELNGSHLGFRLSSSGSRASWQPVTAHLGAVFDSKYKGPGFRVDRVIHGSPAALEKSKLNSGDTITAVDGTPVAEGASVASVLTGLPQRDIALTVSSADGKNREVRIRPISYATARALRYEQWVRDNRSKVDKASGGKLAYLHIRGMDMPSFYRFEQELYELAGNREGIVIDVRENGGGFTTDHLLTVLTQPVHAITVPRGGTAGYPQDRRIYATWNKPIIVLCNQNSFSNAEIFSHAIKGLKRGTLVGVTTSGSVISTGSRRIMDLGTLRMPFRGWYVSGSGQDMELNGAVPDHIIWPLPGEWPAGVDKQLDKAIELLNASVKEKLAQPRIPLRKASER